MSFLVVRKFFWGETSIDFSANKLPMNGKISTQKTRKIHWWYTVVENKNNPYKDLARSLHSIYSFEGLARKNIPCKNCPRKYNLCKMFQGNNFLARSYKECDSLPDSCKICRNALLVRALKRKHFFNKRTIYMYYYVTRFMLEHSIKHVWWTQLHTIGSSWDLLGNQYSLMHHTMGVKINTNNLTNMTEIYTLLNRIIYWVYSS